MITKELGKITFAEFGTVKDYPFLIGLQLGEDIEVLDSYFTEDEPEGVNSGSGGLVNPLNY